MTYISHIHRFSSRHRNDFLLGFISYRNVWQENLFEKQPWPCPLSVFNFHKQVCATGSANDCPLLKLLSTTLVSFTSCCDLDLYSSAICRQSLVDLNWGFSFRFNQNYNKILECDWLSPAMIWALIGQLGQCNWTVYASCLSNWTIRIRARALMDQLHLNKFFLRIVKLLSIPSPVRFLPFLLLILL